MAAYDIQKVLTVHHWNESLFTFTCTRGASLRFESGHFVMVGIMVDDKALLRAYSIASGVMAFTQSGSSSVAMLGSGTTRATTWPASLRTSIGRPSADTCASSRPASAQSTFRPATYSVTMRTSS